MVTPTVRRAAVGEMRESFGVSERRACRALGVDRSSARYRSRRAIVARLSERLLALAAERPRFGYRRLHVLLQREGFAVNRKRIYRLYRAENLMVRKRKRRRVAAQLRAPLLKAMRPNERWSMDFVLDSLSSGRRFRVLNVVDDCTRESVAMEVDASLGGERVARVLDEAGRARGLPAVLVVDNGPEFTSRALDRWAYERGVRIHFIRPGKPVENAYVESFNGRFRDECLNQSWFPSMHHARALIAAWRDDYNRVRPHSSLGNMTPSAFAITRGVQS